MNQNLYSNYYDKLNPNNILPEYPRPQFVRSSYINLNGYWDYKISKTKFIPDTYDGKILVPFPLESLLSTVVKRIEDSEYLIYKRNFSIQKSFMKDLVFLNFGAVDNIATIYLNKIEIFNHIGGYFPFSVDITNYLEKSNELIVIVKDKSNLSYYAHGKQSINPKGIWYTPITGIWQTVWLESVSHNYLKSIKITPDIDQSSVNIKLDISNNYQGLMKILDNETEIVTKTFNTNEITIKIDQPKLWSPENPHLYNIIIDLGDDVVTSYFAMRKFSIDNGPFGKAIFLNNKPCFMNGLLDQGYYSDGLYTAASDQALIDDIKTMKDMGFNTLRKHCKIEPLRWYYHCDRLGMIVWQDIINGGNYNFFKMSVLPILGFQKANDRRMLKISGRNSENARITFKKELTSTINLLYNSPSIALWTIFNEGWGQYNSIENYHLAKKLDSTRIIDHASGWFDQKGLDLASKHIYFKKVKIKKDFRPIVLSEFGGYSYKIPEHSYDLKNEFGYRKFQNKEEFQKAFISLYENEIIPNIKKGLCACIYTQLSDVETETNGILTYDRKVNKFDLNIIKDLNQRIKY